MLLRHIGIRGLRGGLACVAILVATAIGAAAAGFSDGLSPGERAACGISTLTPTQVAALDSLVKRDVDLAHQGAVTSFSSTFTERCTPPEAASSGINHLNERDRTVLDSLVARAIALGPPAAQAFEYAPPPAPVPNPAPVPMKAPVLAVHGDVAVSLGAGGHGSYFYGTSADLFVTDPTGKYTVGVGFSEYRGRGFLAPCDTSLLGPPLGGW